MERKTAIIPIARIGRWYHPFYRNNKGEPVVEFDQADFDSIINTWTLNDRGYPPYLRYGHKLKGDGIADGEPAQGWMVNIKQVDDVLYGEFEATSDNVLEEIRLNKYRFSSGEFVRNYPSKQTGERIRVYLRGVALTNTPFIPNLPKNVVKVTNDEFSEYVLLSDLVGAPTEEEVISLSTNSLTIDDLYYEIINLRNQLTPMESDNSIPPNPTEESTMNHGDEGHNCDSACPDFVKPVEETQECSQLSEDTMVGTQIPSSFFENFINKIESMFGRLIERQETMKPSEALADPDAAPLDPTQTETETEENDIVSEEEKQALSDRLAVLEAELAAKEQALSDRQAQLDEINRAKQEADKKAHEQRLSDMVGGLTRTSGLAPVVADKILAFITDVSSPSMNLSDSVTNEAFATNLVNLFSEALDSGNRVELQQAGSQADSEELSEEAGNPWGPQIAELRKLRSAN